MQVIVNTANKKTQRKQINASNSASIPDPRPTQVTEARRAPMQAEPTLVARAVQILSEESGIALTDLTDSTQLSDVGIDSLMSLVVGSRYREDLNIDMETSTLIDYVTVKDLKDFVRRSAQDDIELSESVLTGAIKSEIKPALPLKTNSFDIITTWSKALKIISEESGIGIDDLTDETAFVDVGIDSLLALVIGSRYRDELGLDLPLDASLFIDNRTIKDLQRNILQNSDNLSDTCDSTANSSPQTESNSTDTTSLSSASPEGQDLEEEKKQQASNVMVELHDDNNSLLQIGPEIHPAWSIALQGAPRKAEKILFLFPDGCGAASSYLGLPRISPSVAVVGFNSPFMKNPSEMQNYPLASIVSSYIQGIRRHQPHGPYYLGGWSAGGILAYAIAFVLIAKGEQVLSLICIDSPAPTNGLDRLPQRFFDHCSKVGLFGTELAKNTQNNGVNRLGRNVPEWLMPHFHATIEILHDYQAQPMPADRRAPKINLLWAGECALDGIRYPKLPPPSTHDEDTKGMKFLTEKRTDTGPGDWAALFPGQEVHVDTVLGEDHFSMMRAAGAARVGKCIEKAMSLI